MSHRGPLPLVRPPGTTGRDSLFVTLALLGTTVIGGAQAFLIVFVLGGGEDTDAFLSVYSFYTAVVLFGVSLRRGLVPMLGAVEAGLERRAGALLERTGRLSRRIGLASLATAPLVGLAVSHGMTGEGRRVAIESMLLLSVAAYFQLDAGSRSAVLNAGRRFPLSAALYVTSGATALVVSATGLLTAGVLGAPVGLLVGAVVLSLGHRRAMRRFGVVVEADDDAPGLPRLPALAIHVLASGALVAAQQLSLTVALLGVSDAREAATAYAYAFFLISVIGNLSSTPLSLVSMPAYVGLAGGTDGDALGKRFVAQSGLVLALALPSVAALMSFGDVLLGFVFDPALSDATTSLMHRLTLALGGLVVPMALSTLLGAIVLAVGRWRAALVMGAAAVLLQLAAVFAVRGEGPVAVASAHLVTSMVVTVVLLRATFPGTWAPMAVQVAHRAAAPALLALLFPLLRLGTGRPSVPLAIVAIALGALLYVLALNRLAPQLVAPFRTLAGGRLARSR